MRLLFWISTGALLLPWVLYPAWAFALARLRPRRPRVRYTAPTPGVSVLIVARDEAPALGAKLDSLAGAGIPPDRLDVVVVDDGSGDETSAIAAARGARVVRLPRPRGKAAALNAGVAAAAHDLLVLTDARQPLSDGALRALIAPLADPRVGAVGGELDVPGETAGAIYRRFDDGLRRLEAATASTVGVTGALWAVRRSLMPRLPEGLILDDVLAPLHVARAGRRVVVAVDARAREPASAAGALAERRRRLRTLAGNLQLLARAPWLLVPGRNPLWGRFVAHKVARLAGPAALTGASVALARLAPGGGPYAALAAAAGVAAALALLGRRAGLPGVLARGFAEAQWLCAVAWGLVLAGRTDRLWRVRTGPAPEGETAAASPVAAPAPPAAALRSSPALGAAGASHGAAR